MNYKNYNIRYVRQHAITKMVELASNPPVLVKLPAGLSNLSSPLY